MRLTEFGVGKIVKGVNTTIDVGVDEITKQAKKFGNQVDRNGQPPVNPSGKIKLAEAVDITWQYENAAKFEVKGMTYVINFINSFGKENEWEVEFSPIRGDRFANSGEMGTSSIQVFSTVIIAIGEFIDRENPDVVYFIGEKGDNRVDLYSKLINKFSQQLKAKGYSVAISKTDKFAEYTISKSPKVDQS
jgi:hypothetical protein